MMPDTDHINAIDVRVTYQGHSAAFQAAPAPVLVCPVAVADQYTAAVANQETAHASQVAADHLRETEDAASAVHWAVSEPCLLLAPVSQRPVKQQENLLRQVV